MMRMIRYTAWAAVAVLAISAAIIYAVNEWPRGEGTRVALPIGGPFTLTTHEGERFSSDALKGKPFAVFFGFTHCPDICPTTLAELTETIGALGEDADRMRYVFITVDPERDTPELLKSYVTSFDRRIIGLTGTAQEISDVARAYRVYYEKAPTADSYTMNHSALIYLMDGEGRFQDVVAYGVDAAVRLEKFRKLIEAS